jgi:HAD superfamily hydrolase (TIGR01484 family)
VYFLALAADYDGTIAHDGVVDDQTIHALKEFKESGRRLILVTGRELPDLKRVFPELGVFDRVVAENGALIYDPASEQERSLAEPPPAAFIDKLKERKIAPLSIGRTIVATWEPHEAAVLEIIRDLGLELNIIFNKGAVMVLPPGINKSAGLEAALAELELSSHNVVAVGDAENDHAFLQSCGCAAAVANALPMLKASADTVLSGERGAGVVELLDRIGTAFALASTTTTGRFIYSRIRAACSLPAARGSENRHWPPRSPSAWSSGNSNSVFSTPRAITMNSSMRFPLATRSRLRGSKKRSSCCVNSARTWL